MQPKWPLAGNFLWSLFASATNEQVQEQIALKLGVSAATISRLFSGNGSFEATAHQTWKRLYPSTSSHEQQNQLIWFIKNALKHLDELESIGSFALDNSTPDLAKKFLTLRGLSDDEGRPTEAFFEWLSDRRTLQAKKNREGDSSELAVENALDSPGSSLSEKPLSLEQSGTDRALTRRGNETTETAKPSSFDAATQRAIAKALTTTLQVATREVEGGLKFEQASYELPLKDPILRSEPWHFSLKATKIYGREEEQAALRNFAESAAGFTWLQIAGTAGQGKSRLALYLIEYLRDIGWAAGFLWEKDFEVSDVFQGAWEPNKPHLIVFDYVTGSVQNRSRFLQYLASNRHFDYPVCVLFLERQPWNVSGLGSQIASDGSKLYGQTRAMGRADWFTNLHYSADCHDLASESLRQGTSVVELEPLEISDSLTLINEVLDKSPYNPHLDEQSILRYLKNIDLVGRPLYAHLFALSLVANDFKLTWGENDLLDASLDREISSRWNREFLSDCPALDEMDQESPALRLALLAIITRRFSYHTFQKHETHFRLKSKNGPKSIVLRQAHTICDGFLQDARRPPQDEVIGLEPDILGERLVLRAAEFGLPVNEVMSVAWKEAPDETAAFILRLTQDFPGHDVTLKFLSDVPRKGDAAKAFSVVVTQVFDHVSNLNGDAIKQLVKWLKEVGPNRNLSAGSLLGLCLVLGVGTRKNLRAGLKLIKHAANNGNARAMVCWALLHWPRYGVLTIHDAFSRIHSFGEDDGLIIYSLLGHVDLPRKDIKTNAEESYQWLRAASEKSDSSAYLCLGWAHLIDLMTYKDSALAFANFEKAALLGEPRAMAKLAECYYYGTGCEPSPEHAESWFVAAAKNSGARGMRALAEYFDIGQTVKQDPEKASHWMTRAAERRDTVAMFKLASWYQAGHNVQPDSTKSAFWMKVASNAGHPSAAYEMGERYENGEGVKECPDSAFRFFLLADQRKDIRSYPKLGECYSKGIGTQVDLQQASHWFRIADGAGFFGASQRSSTLAAISRVQDSAPVDQNDIRSAFETNRFEPPTWNDEPQIAGNWLDIQDEQEFDRLTSIISCAVWEREFDRTKPRPVRTIRALRSLKLPACPDWQLVEALVTFSELKGEKKVLSALVSNHSAILLDGKSNSLVDFFYHVLDGKDMNSGKLRFQLSAAYVHYDGQPFHICGSENDLRSQVEDKDAIRERVSKKIHVPQRVASSDNEIDIWECVALFGDCLYEICYLWTKYDGFTLTKNRKIVSSLPTKRRRYEGYFRSVDVRG